MNKHLLDTLSDYLLNVYELSGDPVSDLSDLGISEVQVIKLLASWVTIDPKERLSLGFSQDKMHALIIKAMVRDNL